jgi:glycosyltransferase involved in cell wall biosynthesis
VDARGIDEPVSAVRALLRDPVRARAMGAAGRAAVESFFNWERVVADLMRLGDEQHSRALARSA